ncbi:EF-hand domain-containing protein [Nonomuraea sp. NPDC050547]|uniref:EF-hand domain-containing protein n=1 Tax=Nonomuraea sp. NPDC050547 TaxID=3364368 RepID=UPI0037A85A7D
MPHQALQTPTAAWEGRDTFDLFDSDRDGQLSADEVLLGLTVMGEPVTRHDVEFLIDLIDDDGDGRITRANFDRLRERAPAPFYSGELLYGRFGADVLDIRSLSRYLLERGLRFTRAQVGAFLRNLHPDGLTRLPRERYAAFVRAYRDA